MIASLPMYDWPHRRAANDALWAHLRGAFLDCGLAAPKTLSRPTALMAHWRRPSLLFSQTCAMPYRLGLWRHTHVLGTFDYNLPGCAAGEYYSVIIARRGDPRSALAAFATATPAVNARHSQSGWAALCDAARMAAIELGKPVITGSHARSVQAVASGRADMAAIDAQSWQLAQEALPEATQVKVIATTRPSPALPLICGFGQDVTGLRAALAQACAHLPTELQSQFGELAFLPRDDALYRQEPWDSVL